MNRRLYALHRWVSLFAFLQLGIWSASGLAFSLLPEASVKGARVKGAHELPLSGSLEGLRSPGDILAVDSTITGIELRRGPAGPVYLVRAPSGLRRFDARTGEPAPVTEDEAREVARRDQPGRPEIQTLALLTAKPPIEYRDRPLPAWQVQLADPAETMVYIDATSGEVTARRTATWRLYDFLWGLHIMDYSGREDFRHLLLQATAVIALLTGASGMLLWSLRAVRAFRSLLAARARVAKVG